MRIILLGPPGSGKGTQAQFISERLGVPKISTGDMLRKAILENSPVGLQAKALMDRGELVSDDIIISLVKERIKQSDCEKGFLFDGFPRTVKQAEAITLAGIPIDTVVEIMVPDEKIVKRLSGRRVHIGSGRIYHIEHQPPIKENVDDVTGGSLVQREDDKEETIRARLTVYHTQTQPVATYFMGLSMARESKIKYIKIDGLEPPLVVFDKISRELK